MPKIVASIALLLPGSAFAGVPPAVPEPGLLSLLGAAAVVGVVIAVRRRK